MRTWTPRGLLVAGLGIAISLRAPSLTKAAEENPLLVFGGDEDAEATVASQMRRTRAKPKAYIHVGSHKVASSYIQATTCIYMDILGAHGLTVPLPEGSSECKKEGFCRKHFAGVALALQQPVGRRAPNATIENYVDRHSCIQGSGMGAIAALRKTLAKTEGDVFMSSEEFDMVGPDGIAYLADIYRDYDVRILIMYRGIVDHMLSCYSERMRHERLQRDIFSYVLGFNDFDHCGDAYPRLVADFAAVFGADKVHVASLEGIRSAGVGVLDFVLRTFAERSLDEDIQTIASAQASHLSPSAPAVSLWTFVQDLWAVERPERPIPFFPWWHSTRAACMAGFVDAMLKTLGDAWHCIDASGFADAVTARDLQAMRTSQVQMHYFGSKANPAAAPLPGKLCGVQPTLLKQRGSRRTVEEILKLADDALDHACA